MNNDNSCHKFNNNHVTTNQSQSNCNWKSNSNYDNGIFSTNLITNYWDNRNHPIDPIMNNWDNGKFPSNPEMNNWNNRNVPFNPDMNNWNNNGKAATNPVMNNWDNGNVHLNQEMNGWDKGNFPVNSAMNNCVGKNFPSNPNCVNNNWNDGNFDTVGYNYSSSFNNQNQTRNANFMQRCNPYKNLYCDYSEDDYKNIQHLRRFYEPNQTPNFDDVVLAKNQQKVWCPQYCMGQNCEMTANRPISCSNTSFEGSGMQMYSGNAYQSGYFNDNNLYPNDSNFFNDVYDSSNSSSLQQHSQPSQKAEKKPREALVPLIASAILSSSDNKMNLANICRYIKENSNIYGQMTDEKWKNNVRHTLSHYEFFVKSRRIKGGRGFYWAVHEACLNSFREKDFRIKRARRQVEKYLFSK
ncbi:hypothetical protein HELRODRAFT_162194 [Helobdella robusta]|uniref:Fork-head domain-containing protein n=1 Tax=Helobdella robusta TaxID=6412 RepID=T1ESC3_HELRO|nr:hypothetical protein HELRODRAFT_162194 [Helobdella robusta]ESN98743.1 hypothetical protein HELRODRAFT_162194 [Helobdella robusta]